MNGVLHYTTAEKKTIGVFLPGIRVHLMAGQYAPAGKVTETGVHIALAADFNPGNCPTL
jgi:imidazolonepropionase-like amidohydrolase